MRVGTTERDYESRVDLSPRGRVPKGVERLVFNESPVSTNRCGPVERPDTGKTVVPDTGPTHDSFGFIKWSFIRRNYIKFCR